MNKTICLLFLACGAITLGMTTLDGSASGQEVTEEDPAPAPAVDLSVDDTVGDIENVVQSYVTAFNQRDADAFRDLWTADGVYTIRSTGERIQGRDAIVALFKEMVADPSSAPTLAVQIDSMEYVSPNVALGRGTAVVTKSIATTSETNSDDSSKSDTAPQPSETNFTAVYVKQGESWLIDRVTEEDKVLESGHYAQLQKLEWLIGEWVDAGEGFTIEMTCDWTKKQNFISRKFSVRSADDTELSGLQIIGWDPQEQTIRSWLFDSEGAVVTGTWTQREDRWVVQSVATLPGGSKASFTSLYQPISNDGYRFQKVNQVVDGQLLPNVDEVVVQRK